MTFQLHSMFFQVDHVYITDQHMEMILVSSNRIENNARIMW